MGKTKLLTMALLTWACLNVYGEKLKINGSTTVNPPIAEAAEILRAEIGMDIHVDTQGGSSGGIAMLAEGLVDIGMSSKELTDAIRKRHPQVHFYPIHVGQDAVALAVSADVWEGGLRAISKEQMRAIYEKKIINWKELGGPDKRIAFFNKEPGRGTWEVFAMWLYGESREAPLVSWPEVGGNEETRNKVSTTRGALSQLSVSWVDNKTVFALSLIEEDGSVVDPVLENTMNGTYTLSRPLYIITRGKPKGNVRKFIDFILSARGQHLFSKHGYLSLQELGKQP